MLSLCMYVHEGLCFQYTALRNHRSVPQQTTSYATGQTACLHKWPLKVMVMFLLVDGRDVLHWCVFVWICMVQWCKCMV